MPEPLLRIDDLHVSYGAIQAIKGVSLTVDEGAIVTLIGANGAGKSTLLRTVSGLLRPRQGSITYQGRSTLGVAAHLLVGHGLVQVPEGRHIFASMTVLENLQLGAYLRSDHEGIARDLEHVYELFPRLRERIKQVAGTLSGGEQQMLAMGRALMSRPRLLLLDEPSMGLAPLLVREIFAIIRRINQEGVTILLVEQNARQALACAQRAYVLESGAITLHGDAATLASDPAVQQAYLGI